MAKDFSTMEDSNTSLNPTIHDVSVPSRRVFLRGGVAAAAAGLFGPMALVGCASTPAAGSNPAALGRSIGFKSVPMAALDTVTGTPAADVVSAPLVASCAALAGLLACLASPVCGKALGMSGF